MTDNLPYMIAKATFVLAEGDVHRSVSAGAAALGMNINLMCAEAKKPMTEEGLQPIFDVIRFAAGVTSEAPDFSKYEEKL